MDYPKSDPSIGLVNGKFTDGDEVNGVPPSQDPAAWANAVTDEILAVLAEGGEIPSEANLTQLRDAIIAIIAARAEARHQDNLSATVDPTVNDDATAGYSVNSKWLNTTKKEFYVCLDATAGAAVWQQTTLTIDELGSAATHNTGVAAATDLPTRGDADGRYARLDAANTFGGTQTAPIFKATG